MKKKILIIIISLFSVSSVYAFRSKFMFDAKDLSFTNGKYNEKLLSEVDNKYLLKTNIESTNSLLEQEVIDFTKKVTHLLLGDMNNTNESSESYFNRKKEFRDLLLTWHFPQDEFGNFDETKENYIYAVSSGFLMQIFNQVSEKELIYKTYGDIRVILDGDRAISKIIIPNVIIKEKDPENPRVYRKIMTNYEFVYTFVKLDGKYYIGYIYGLDQNDMDMYMTDMEDNEKKNTLAINPIITTNFSDIYSFKNIEKIEDSIIRQINDDNIDNLLYLTGYYNTSQVTQANGFFISNGLAVTTWDFLEASLKEAQTISVHDMNQNSYYIDGIVTMNPETDIVVLKIRDAPSKHVILGDSNKLGEEDAAIIISSKSGVGSITQKGIILSNDKYIQTSIPLTKEDEGSVLLDENGYVVGINTAKSTDSRMSIAINSDVLKEIQDKFKDEKYENINAVKFSELKEKYYYTKIENEQKRIEVSKRKLDKYLKIGNLKDNISLELLKANYKDNVMTLRYVNKIPEYIDTMQFANSYRKELIREGFKEKINTGKKAIYENNKFKIVIMNEFDYLIVVMVKK